MRRMERLSSAKRRLAVTLASLTPMLGGALMLAGRGSTAPSSLGPRDLASIRGGNDYYCKYTYACSTGCPTGATQQWLGDNYKKCGGTLSSGCTENGAVTCTHWTYPMATCAGTGTMDNSIVETSCS